MKILTNYSRNGYKFELLIRIGDNALYEGSREGFASTFETIRIQSHNGREIHGTWVDPAEYPPSNTQWGTKGWTYNNYDKAFDKLALL